MDIEEDPGIDKLVANGKVTVHPCYTESMKANEQSRKPTPEQFKFMSEQFEAKFKDQAEKWGNEIKAKFKDP